MLTEIKYDEVKSYANRKTLDAAIAKRFPTPGAYNLRYIVVTLANGRLVPVFIGQKALELGVHFTFPVVG